MGEATCTYARTMLLLCALCCVGFSGANVSEKTSSSVFLDLTVEGLMQRTHKHKYIRQLTVVYFITESPFHSQEHCVIYTCYTE